MYEIAEYEIAEPSVALEPQPATITDFSLADNPFLLPGRLAQATDKSAGDRTAESGDRNAIGKRSLDRQQLELSLGTRIHDPGALRKFINDLNTFESNARVGGISHDRIDETYRQMNRILNASASGVPQELRTRFVEQWSGKLADPYSVKQGWHDTCGMAFQETYELIHHPEALTRTIADALVLNHTQVPDTNEGFFDKLFGRAGEPKMRALQFDPENYKPDLEAQGKTPSPRSRDYADQVAQVTLNTIKWDTSEELPNGQPTRQGTMKFKQCERVERPSDTNPPDPSRDRSCESVEYTDAKGVKQVVDNGGYGFGGQSTREDIMRIHKAITGDERMIFAIRDREGIQSEAGLKMFLEALRDAGRMPIGAMVHPARPGIREDYLTNHPEKTDVSESTMAHIITIKGIDASGNIEIHNPWGFKRTFTPAQLWEAMRLPGR